jgi:hypothetical protein
MGSLFEAALGAFAEETRAQTARLPSVLDAVRFVP